MSDINTCSKFRAECFEFDRTALPNVFHKELVFPLVFVPLTKNVMEKNLVGFPNSMFFHVGPCTPYFGPNYGGKGSVLVMWLPTFDPLVNIMTPPKPILGLAQTLIIIDYGELLDEDDDSSKRKHNPRMPQIVLIIKPYNERRGRPSVIGDGVGPPPSGWNVPINNSVGKSFSIGGSGPSGLQ